jgi:hypothetical protein
MATGWRPLKAVVTGTAAASLTSLLDDFGGCKGPRLADWAAIIEIIRMFD